MSSKLDPINVTKLKAYLPSTTKIINCFANSATTSTLVISDNGAESNIAINKQSLNETFKITPPLVNYTSKMQINDVIKTFSDNNKLGLVKGIDYKDDPSLVMLTDNKAVVLLTILSSSPLYTGVITINVFTPTVTTKGATLLTQHVADLNVAIELSLNVLFTPTAPVFANDTLTVETMTALRETFKDNTIVTSKTLDDVAGGTILSYTLFNLNDKVYCLTLLVTPNNNLYYFKLPCFDEKDIPVLSLT